MTAPSNAVAESFFATIKRELIDTPRSWPTRTGLHRAVFEYIEGWFKHPEKRLHQSVGDRPPAERFMLRPEPTLELVESEDSTPWPEDYVAPRITRRVDRTGRIHLKGFNYLRGRHLSGEVVEIAFSGGLVEISYRGDVVTTHARRRPAGKEPRIAHEPRHRSARPSTTGPVVTRVVDGSGSVSFAGSSYCVGNPYKRLSVTVASRSVQISYEGAVVKEHPIRHDRAKEFGAFSTLSGRPRNRKVNQAKAAG